MPKERVYEERIPDLLAGIWQRSERILMFGKNDGDFACVLREFYGRYADRAAEKEAYAQLSTPLRNNTSHSPAEHIMVRYYTIAENSSRTAGAYELSVSYPGKKEAVYIPLCVIDDKLYLDFSVRGSAEYTDESRILAYSASGLTDRRGEAAISGALTDISARIPSDEGFWRAFGAASGITLSPPVIKKELVSYYAAPSAWYHIRYWLTDMPYSYEKAYFSDGDESYTVDKYLLVAGSVYTCATGRRVRIRNIEKSTSLPFERAVDKDFVFAGVGDAYLLRVDGKDDFEDVAHMVADINSQPPLRAKAPFPPVFPRVKWPDYQQLDLYDPASWSRRNIDLGK